MNLLIDTAPDYILVGGEKLKIKTDFTIWVKFLIAVEEKDDSITTSILTDIFGELPVNVNVNELVRAVREWLYQAHEKADVGYKNSHTTSKTAFDFKLDGNIIFCELWEYFPHLMKQSISFQTGLELIKLLISNENTMMYHRAFARCGEFSKMSKEQKAYWQKERAKYAIRARQEDIDDIFSRCF